MFHHLAGMWWVVAVAVPSLNDRWQCCSTVGGGKKKEKRRGIRLPATFSYFLLSKHFHRGNCSIWAHQNAPWEQNDLLIRKWGGRLQLRGRVTREMRRSRKGKKNSQVREWKPCGVDVDLTVEPARQTAATVECVQRTLDFSCGCGRKTTPQLHVQPVTERWRWSSHVYRYRSSFFVISCSIGAPHDQLPPKKQTLSELLELALCLHSIALPFNLRHHKTHKSLRHTMQAKWTGTGDTWLWLAEQTPAFAVVTNHREVSLRCQCPLWHHRVLITNAVRFNALFSVF